MVTGSRPSHKDTSSARGTGDVMAAAIVKLLFGLQWQKRNHKLVCRGDSKTIGPSHIMAIVKVLCFISCDEREPLFHRLLRRSETNAYSFVTAK